MTNFKHVSMATMAITLGASAASVVAFAGIANAANLVVNGNFSAGNSGFSSDYTHKNPLYSALWDEETYGVGTSPLSFHSDASSFGDHTTGTGNMMVVNGSPSINSTVWSQTINVDPNTEYDFATWIASWYPENPAQLQFSINSTLIGSIFTASSTTGLWEQFSATWNSGSNTLATISIVNQNIVRQGNDFALDDISFEAVADPTPVPEPSSLLGLLAFGAVGLTRLKRKK